MNASIPFDNVIIDGVSIGSELLVPGSASLSLSGDDKSMPASDGTFANVRTALLRQVSFRGLGDRSALSSPQGWPVPVSLHLEGEEIVAFDAVVSVSYDDSSRLSSFTLKSEPETA